jgi:hypothetical protein
MAFNEAADYGLNLPDKVSYEITDLGDCADVTDDTVIGDYHDLGLLWSEFTYFDSCYAYETRRAAFIDIYIP